MVKNEAALQMLSTAICSRTVAVKNGVISWRMLSDTKNKERDCQDSLIFHDSEKHQQQRHLAVAARADVGDTVNVSEGRWYWLNLVC